MSKHIHKKKSGPNIYELYYQAQEKYAQIYGEKAIVFFQMGKFYEAYNSKKNGYQYLEDLVQVLGIQFVKKDGGTNAKKNDSRPNQFGIPCVAIRRHLATLVENGYTIILYDQIHDGDEIEREISGVYSSATFLSDKQLSEINYLLCVYLTEEKQMTKNKTLMAIGITLVDISTGTNMVHEFYSNKLDEKFGLDELIRILQTFRPVEIIIYYHPVEIDHNTISDIKQYLELDKFKNCYFYIYHGKKGDDNLSLLTEPMIKINYQNDYLADIYDTKSKQKNQSTIEHLQLENKSYAVISLLIVLRYLYEHNRILLKNLPYPQIYLYNKHLILGNNAIEQLNVISDGGLEYYNRKIRSLFDVVNKTSTPMGKRFLKESLTNPSSQEDKHIITQRYTMIEELMKDEMYVKLRVELKNIFDMERLHRRMAMGVIVFLPIPSKAF